MVEDFSRLSDEHLVDRVGVLAMRERVRKAGLVAAIAELDARRLYLAAGCPSLFVYCTQVLHLSEAAAYLRIEAARASRRFPAILPRLADGRLSLTTATLLASILTDENQVALLEKVAFKSRREVELIIASTRPQSGVAAIVRELGTSEAGDSAAVQAADDWRHADPRRPTASSVHPQPSVRALAAQRYHVQFTLSGEGHARLRRAQNLLRHAIPDGDVAAVFERALATLVAELEKAKFAATSRPRAEAPRASRTRHVPAAIRRAVWARDEGQCAFTGTQGRCTERAFLEYHHVIPYAAGGETSVANMQLRCAAHNAYEASLWFGEGAAATRDG